MRKSIRFLCKRPCLFLIVVALILSLGQSFFQRTLPPPALLFPKTSSSLPPEEAGFVLEGAAETEHILLSSFLSGHIRNNSGKEALYLRLTFALYDSSGQLVGQAQDILKDVAPGESKEFLVSLPFGTKAEYGVLEGVEIFE